TRPRLFFFSSRRRHTRWPRDWSSDVCSSDLSEKDPVSEAPTSLSASVRCTLRFRLQQQHIDPMRVDHLFTWRPRENREASILRGHQRLSISLIVYELCRRQVARAPVLYRRNH